METQSSKAKGRRLQQKVVALILEANPTLEADDVRSTSMGAGGEDVLLSPKGREVFPYSIECKNQERVNVWKSYEQAVANAKGHEPLLVISKNRKEPLVIVSADYFIKELKHAKNVQTID